MPLIDDRIRANIGLSESFGPLEVTRREIRKYAAATEQRIEKFKNGDEAPLLFLFGLIRPVVEPSELPGDGLGIDPLLPELPLERVMAGGTRIRVHRHARPGDVLEGERRIADIYEKEGRSGPLIFVAYELSIRTLDGEPIVDETQTRIVR